MIENVLGLRKRSTFHIIHHTTTFESASMKETETNLSREREERVFLWHMLVAPRTDGMPYNFQRRMSWLPHR